ncbi:MAG: aldolase/citrate lyase family protein [Dehalococcoidia bacterium]|nr:aldolase/citrate lyase family protein [Dehalococcoidia bacterium]MDW8120233.1 aldolase/citrate lyase family protein [Chloroflexota bacterium]
MGRVNRAIDLLEKGLPVFTTGTKELTYANGKRMAQTWADYLTVDLEHATFDLAGLDAFMRGLVDGGPTPTGHRTPAVIVVVPATGASVEEVRANAWMFKQVLARGVHGILLAHAESPEAVRAFVEACRYPFHTAGVGRRGNGGQETAAAVWGVSVEEYLERAEPWPLAPQGEVLLGVKIETRRALPQAEAIAQVPGLAFAEWGPGDMGMSFGYRDRHDPPYPPEMVEARNRVFAACRSAGLAFLEAATPETVEEKIREGVRILACRSPETAERGREVGRSLMRG